VPQPAEPQTPGTQKPEAGAPPIEEKPLAPSPESKPAAEPKAAAEAAKYEVKKGDTLGAIARQHLTPGVTLDQMLIAIYRANQEAFHPGEHQPGARRAHSGHPRRRRGGHARRSTTAKRLVQSHRADFNAYRARLAATPAPAEATPGQQEVAGKIEPKPGAAPQEKQDQLRLSKADPKKPSAPAARAAQADDLAARERALREAQSRVTDLEKKRHRPAEAARA